MEKNTIASSVMSDILAIIKKMGAITIGEITELYNSEYADKDNHEARNEVAKIVDHLANDGSIQRIGYRKCTVAGRKVLEWTADMDAMPDQSRLQQLSKEVESKRIKAENATADHQSCLELYKELFKKMVPEANIDDETVETMLTMMKEEHGVCKVKNYCILETALDQDLDILAIQSFSETTGRSEGFKRLYDSLPSEHVTMAAVKQLEKLAASVPCLKCNICTTETWSPAEVAYQCKNGHNLAEYNCEIEMNEGGMFKANIRNPEDKVIHTISAEAGKNDVVDGFIKNEEDSAPLASMLKSQNVIPSYATLTFKKNKQAAQ